MSEIQQKYHDEQQILEGFMTQIMGTRFHVLMAGISQEEGLPIWQWMTEEMSRLDKMMNRFDPLSELSQFNADPMNAPLSEELEQILLSCIAYREKTNGLFDVTRGGQEDVDLGGFAKGYALSVMKNRISEAGIQNVMMDFGGSTIVAMGKQSEGEGWKVRLDSPFTGQLLGEYELYDETMSTSGNTPGYTAHIVNPLTGARISGSRLSVVLAQDTLDAEVLSTTLMIASPAERELICAQFDGIRTWMF